MRSVTPPPPTGRRDVRFRAVASGKAARALRIAFAARDVDGQTAASALPLPPFWKSCDHRAAIRRFRDWQLKNMGYGRLMVLGRGPCLLSRRWPEQSDGRS
jgi:hypothetical protein